MANNVADVKDAHGTQGSTDGSFRRIAVQDYANVAHYVAKRQFDVITYVANYVAKGLRSRDNLFHAVNFRAQ